jgi:hypothetical protein
MGQTEKRVEAVAALIADRRKYESWLAALEAKRAETPDHVFLRVRSDYERRLSEVLERLRSQASALNERADALTARLAALVEEERAVVDRRSEAELRRAVGEFMPREWDALLKDSAETVARIAAERTTIQTELSEIRELLGGGKSGGTTAPRPPATGAPKGFQPGAGVEPPPELPPDELAFLRSLITSDAQGKAGPGTPAPPLAPAQSGVIVKESEPLLVDPGRSGRDTPPLAMNVPGSEAIVIRSDKDGKTLKCGECGALNIPTEWYCERCGSELAPT